MHGKNEPSIREVGKKDRDIRASLDKVTATVRDRCLVRMEKAPSLWARTRPAGAGPGGGPSRPARGGCAGSGAGSD